ncbi:MAG: glycosyltransferase family 39 protein [Saprospiraceae bacterium]|nr:glycosyltransferase family 39 protein [Saprospiraceae bacterium]
MAKSDKSFPFIIVAMAMISFLSRLLTNGNYGYHRDEFLYLALGKHLDWGFWSNPPSPGFFSWLTQYFIGDSIQAIRFFPALLGAATVLLTGLMAREMGGKRFAQFLACFAIMVSSAFPRVFLMYNPVPFDVFYWTLFAWLIIKYINTESGKYVVALGVAIAFGFLNKYSVVFFVLPALAALWLTPYRKLYTSRAFYIAVSAAFILVLPNLIWQWQYNFPVISHMEQLARNQLSNVSLTGFLSDQLLFNLSVIYIWLAGLYFLFRSPQGKPFRLLGWTFVGILLLLLLLRGKSYYTLGAYPMLLAAGACHLENWIGHRSWIKVALPTISFLFFALLSPMSIPYLKLDNMVRFGQFMVNDLGVDNLLRWEDGQAHALPQDYADMLGWEELATLVNKAYQQAGDRESCMIYCSNFGQAGAVEHFGQRYNLPRVVSFADSYVLWAPQKISPAINKLIYVNDELGPDVAALFNSVIEVGRVSHPFARERDTQVYLCSDPKNSLADFWGQRVAQMKDLLNLPQKN